jgi:hypothetical protein
LERGRIPSPLYLAVRITPLHLEEGQGVRRNTRPLIVILINFELKLESKRLLATTVN